MTGNVLLDTSVVVRRLREPDALADKLSPFAEWFLPLPALAELAYGAYRSARPDKHLEAVRLFLKSLVVLTPDNETALQYGKIAAKLAAAGTPIPQNDIWIAALGLQYDFPVATGDSHFQQVEGLQVLLW